MWRRLCLVDLSAVYVICGGLIFPRVNLLFTSEVCVPSFLFGSLWRIGVFICLMVV